MGRSGLDTAEACGDTNNGFGLLFNWNRLEDGEHTVRALVDGVELGRATFTVTTLGKELVTGVTGETVAMDFPSVGKNVRLVWQQNLQNFMIAPFGGEPVASPRGPTDGPLGFLENPGPGSFQSGIAVMSGWVCEAEKVEFIIDDLAPQLAAYGTERLDTEEECGDTDNGFGMLFNWNRLEDGEHTVRALVDGVELGRATVTVTTLGEEFLRGVTGEAKVIDFPEAGQDVGLLWQQGTQNFMIVSKGDRDGSDGEWLRRRWPRQWLRPGNGDGNGNGDGDRRRRRCGDGQQGTGSGSYLDSPAPGSFQTGIGVLCGWVCEARDRSSHYWTCPHKAGRDRAAGYRGGVWRYGQRLWAVVQLEPAGDGSTPCGRWPMEWSWGGRRSR